MVCTYCGNETQVFNSRHQVKTNGVWRRRRCQACSAVFTTVEHIDLEKSFVVNKNGALQPFLRDMLFASVYDSLKHRKTALKDATGLTDTIISYVTANTRDGMISRDAVSKTCTDVLSRFDKTAATYFTAYHPYQT